MELKEFIETLDESEKIVMRIAFADKKTDNHKFQQCYKIAENLKIIPSPKMFRAVYELQPLSAQYVDAIITIAKKMKPKNERAYDMLKDYLVQTYILRLNKLIKADNLELLFCEKEKYVKIYKKLNVRVMDYSEMLDIIYGLGYNINDFKNGYNGKHKTKLAINKIYQFFETKKVRKLEKIKDETFDDITNRIIDNLESLDIRVGLR